MALLHSKRCLPAATPQAGFFVGWRVVIPRRNITRSLTLAPSQGDTPCNPPHSLADARSFAGGSPLQPPPFRRATPFGVALLHSKRCLPAATPQAGFFVGWRVVIPRRNITRSLTLAPSQGDTPCNPPHSLADARSFAGGNPLQPPPFRRAAPFGAALLHSKRCLPSATPQAGFLSATAGEALTSILRKSKEVVWFRGVLCILAWLIICSTIQGTPRRNITRSLTLAPSQGVPPCNPRRSAEPLRGAPCKHPLRQGASDTPFGRA